MTNCCMNLFILKTFCVHRFRTPSLLAVGISLIHETLVKSKPMFIVIILSRVELSRHRTWNTITWNGPDTIGNLSGRSLLTPTETHSNQQRLQGKATEELLGQSTTRSCTLHRTWNYLTTKTDKAVSRQQQTSLI